MLRQSDDWEVLGVARGASAAEVRAHWLELVKQLHPDTPRRPRGGRPPGRGQRRLRPAPPGRARRRAPRPPPGHATFAVDDFRPVVFEAVLLAAVDVGDVTHADEPFSLDMWVGGGSCHVELVPEAGGSVVSVDCVNVDAGTVAEALAAAIARQGFGVTLGA